METFLHKTETFFWYDYVIIASILIISVCIGIYFAWFRKKSQTIKEYLLGGRSMAALPIGLSVAISHMSNSFLFLVPGEIYLYGGNLVWIIPTLFVNALIGIYIFMPIFYKLKVTTVFEYIARRFDTKTKVLALIIFLFQQTFNIAMITYFSALVLSTGIYIDPFLLSVVCTVICVFYTAVGGFKTVIWSDIFQLIVIIATHIIIIIAGLQSVGGIQTVFVSAKKGHRLDIFDFDADPTKRDSFWIVVLGWGTPQLYHKLTDQAAVQKFLAVSSYRNCVKSIIFSAFCLAILWVCYILIGLILYTRYQMCDPLTSVENLSIDQLVPFFVMDVGRSTLGISGLLAGCVTSTGLSGMSSIFNAFTTVVYHDFICKFYKKKFSQSVAKIIFIIIVFVEGLISIGVSYFFTYSKETYSLIISFTALFNGPMLGLIILGTLFPKANSKGSFYGVVLSILTMTIIVSISTFYQKLGLITYPTKSVNTTGCQTHIFTNTTYSKPLRSVYEVPYIFRITFNYRSLMGVIFTVIFGLLISYFCKDHDQIDAELVFYPCRKKLRLIKDLDTSSMLIVSNN